MKINRLLSVFLLIASNALFADNLNYDHDVSIKNATIRRLFNQHSQTTISTYFDRPSETDLPLSIISPSGRFRIHYTTNGINKPDNTDNNHNNIPDFIDSTAYYFDYAYQKEVIELGYYAPIDDSSTPGTEYDVYVADCGNADIYETYYGLTCTSAPGTLNGHEVNSSFIIIDNNFSADDKTKFTDGSLKQSYNTFGYAGLKITAVHEFHHAIQFSYPISSDVSSFMEMSSTFMEYRFFPEIKDYHNYIAKMLRNLPRYSFGDADGNDGTRDNGYPWSVFLIMLYNKYGDAPLKQIWDNIYEGMFTYQAINEAIKKEGSNTIAELTDVVNWLYFTGSRAIPDKYLDNAELLPEIVFTNTDNYSAPALLTNSNLNPYQIKAMRVIFKSQDEFMANDTLDYFLINDDLKNALYQTLSPTDYSICIKDNSISCTKSIINNKFCFDNSINTDNIIPVLFEHLGSKLYDDDFVFPLPYNPQKDDFIAFPVDFNIPVGEKVELTVYDLNNSLLYAKILSVMPQTVTAEQNIARKVIKWNDIPSDIASGVYIYHLDCNSKKIGKFTVKR